MTASTDRRPRHRTRLLSLALAASAAALLFAGSVSAQTDPAGGRRHERLSREGRETRHARPGAPSRHAEKRQALTRKLGLTDAQREQLRATAKQNRPALDQARQAREAAADTLRAALKAQPRDPATVAAAHVALDQARDAAQSARESRRAQLGAALTPEQLEQLKAARAARKASRK